jgi:hypothetical protein
LKTVAELIEELKLLPQDMLVYIEGYNGGVDDISELHFIKVERDAFKDVKYSGAHDYHYSDKSGTVVGILLA